MPEKTKTKKTIQPLTPGQKRWLLMVAGEPVHEGATSAQAKRALQNLVSYGYAKYLKRKRQWEATKSGQLRASSLAA